MKPHTRAALKDFILQFALRKIKPLAGISVEELRRAFPFHDIFFRDEALIAFKLQRSIVTSLGRGFYAQVAEIIGKDLYKVVRREHPIVCTLPSAMCDTIERIVTELRLRQRQPAHASELAEVLHTTQGSLRKVPIKADLYLDDGPAGPAFIELKSPKPNLDVCAESKRKMLYFLAYTNTQGLQSARAVFALYYNPYFPKPYSWTFTRQILDMSSEVLIGADFWDFVGGPGTYDELLQILAEVKQGLRHP
ncbi:MAG: TdeIII family type II restriction endonuclease [Chloroflexota bacterium]|nr:TdeIII family type II restriction endonuclease [Chloroflexota bacterium]